MGLSERERRRRQFVKMLEDNSLTSEGAAELLHSSVDRIKSWRRDESAKGSAPVPMWAIELLQYKLADKARTA